MPEFSACFGAPFLPLAPRVYAEMLGKRLKQHKAACWLVNTGWSGGKFGVGKRMSLKITRALVNAALSTGSLEKVEFVTEPAFGLQHSGQLPGRSGGDSESAQRLGRQSKPTTHGSRSRGALRGQLPAVRRLGSDPRRWTQNKVISVN